MSVAGYRLLEHTADMGIEAWGRDMPELFVQAAWALRSILFGNCPACCRQQQSVRLQAADSQELLVSWLNEILFLWESCRLVPAAFTVNRLEATALQAVVSGEGFAPGRHGLEHEVKAVTYHQLQLGPESGGWHARLYVDV